jgi:hypothetical protein
MAWRDALAGSTKARVDPWKWVCIAGGECGLTLNPALANPNWPKRRSRRPPPRPANASKALGRWLLGSSLLVFLVFIARPLHDACS